MPSQISRLITFIRDLIHSITKNEMTFKAQFSPLEKAISTYKEGCLCVSIYDEIKKNDTISIKHRNEIIKALSVITKNNEDTDTVLQNIITSNTILTSGSVPPPPPPPPGAKSGVVPPPPPGVHSQKAK